MSPDLSSIVRPGVLWWAGATITGRLPALDERLDNAEAALRARPPADTATVRAMYKRIGLDPTKHRPSSEALLRRVLKGGALPRINTMVDVVNWCSAEFQLPYGLYDASFICGDVILRLGRDGEEYAGIRKDVVHVAGRIAIADDEGPFGNPTSDSARTMVTTETTNALVVVYAPAQLAVSQLERVLQATVERIARACGGQESAPRVP